MVDTIYSEFATALEQKNGEEAILLADSYMEELSDQTAIDVGREVAAKRLLNDGDHPAAVLSQTRTVVELVHETRQLRTENGTLIQALAGGQLDFARGATKVRELADSQDELAEAYDELRQSPAISDLPAILIANSSRSVEIQKAGSDDPSSTGQQIDSTGVVSLRNVGGSTATDISVSTDSSLSGITVDPESISRLDPEQAVETAVDISCENEAGRYELSVKFTSLSGGTTESLQVVIADKQMYIDDAITSLRELLEVFETIQTESNRSLRSYIRITKRSLNRLEDVSEDLSDDSISAKKANQEMFATKQGLGALPKKVRALKVLSDSEVASVQSEIESIIDSVERGIAAGV